eukprot:jgi/Ulvmu1/3888/UM018_0109.1
MSSHSASKASFITTAWPAVRPSPTHPSFPQKVVGTGSSPQPFSPSPCFVCNSFPAMTLPCFLYILSVLHGDQPLHGHPERRSIGADRSGQADGRRGSGKLSQERRLRALDVVFGALWRHPLLSKARSVQVAALTPQLQPYVLKWSCGLGAWAMHASDAAFISNLSAAIQLQAGANPVATARPARRNSRQLSKSPRVRAAAREDAILGSTRTHEYHPTQSWLRRQRRRLHTHGVGGGAQQLAPRHLALLDEFVPAWDGKWQRMLHACQRYLRLRGKLPREGPVQVAAVCSVAGDPQRVYELGADGGQGDSRNWAAARQAGGVETPHTEGSAGSAAAASHERVSVLSGWLIKQRQELADVTLSTERIAALDRALGPQWRSYAPVKRTAPAESEPPVRILYRLCQAALSCGLPPHVLTPVIKEYYYLATACNRAVRAQPLRTLHARTDGGGDMLSKWERALRMLPDGQAERRLRTAVRHITAVPPVDTPRLVKTWDFVLHVSELADFWREHQRHPSRAAAAPLHEQQLSKSVSRWLSLAKSGQMPMDRQELLDYMVQDLRDLGIPASWRESKRVYDQRARWRGFVRDLKAHRAATGSLPTSGDAAWWLLRMRWRKRALRLNDLLWLDTELPGWERDALPVRAMPLAERQRLRAQHAGEAEHAPREGRRLRRKLGPQLEVGAAEAVDDAVH